MSVDDLRLDEHLREFDELHVGRRRERARHVLLGDVAEGNERVDDAGVVLRGAFLSFKGLILRDEIGFLEKFQDVGFVGGHLEKREVEGKEPAGSAGCRTSR